MQAYGEDDYLIFDCPGQIELYSHISVFRSFVDHLKSDGWSLAAVYTLDCQFVGDPTKFIAGSLQAMSAMVQLELPHVNVLTKVDLLGDENKVHNLPVSGLHYVCKAQVVIHTIWQDSAVLLCRCHTWHGMHQ